MAAKAILKFKEAVLQEIPLEKEVLTIGRKDDNDVAIDNQAVSGHHARIVRDGEKLVVEDLHSLNGTFVNGQKISRCDLMNGDLVLVGLHTLEIVSDQVREEKKAFGIRGRSMDETMVIDASSQKKILSVQDKTRPDVLGGMLILDGSTDKREYELKERVTTVGKEEDAGIRLKGFFAPKVAALINRRKDGYFITPSGSKPVVVNGAVVDQRRDLKDGDLVEVAGVKMQFFVKE